MAIQAISGVNPVNRYNVNFKGSNKASNNSVPTGVKSAAIIPALIIPLTIGNSGCLSAQQLKQEAQEQEVIVVDSTAAENNAVNPNDTYQVVPSTEPEKAKPAVQTTQTPQAPQKKTSKEDFVVHRTVENKTLVIVGYSTDSNKASAEKMFLHYKNYDKNPNYEVKAKIFGYCPEPREDGRIVALFGLVGDNKLSIAAFPSGFKPVFDRSVMSETRNNNAVKVLTMKEMLEIGGPTIMKAAPNIEEFVPSPEQQKCVATGD